MLFNILWSNCLQEYQHIPCMIKFFKSTKMQRISRLFLFCCINLVPQKLTLFKSKFSIVIVTFNLMHRFSACCSNATLLLHQCYKRFAINCLPTVVKIPTTSSNEGALV